jgi:exodeoxyribonuclease-5
MMDPSSWDHITNGDNLVICGKHKTRFSVTRRCRAALGFSGPLPCPGEPIICCRNDYDQGLVNGETATLWRITKNYPAYFEAEIINGVGQQTSIRIRPDLFALTHAGQPAPEDMPLGQGALFDWAYAITCHKAQGSEWDNVVVIDDQLMHWDRDFRRRWLYTALTRASQRLIVLETTR